MVQSKYKKSGYILIIISVILVSAGLYKISTERKIPVIFSKKMMSESIWRQYKDKYMEDVTWRTIDRERDYVTTSEGQSYSMLRSVWMGDKETFDNSWLWTKNNLQKGNGKLFAWLFGERSNGTYGILTEMGGQNTASDADVDIAMALLFAYSRWGEEAYFTEAKQVIADIWRQEVVYVNGKPYLAANNVEKRINDGGILLNPSYFAPYAFRIFAEVDKVNDWNAVVDSSYDVLRKSMTSTLDKKDTAKIPPNWVVLNKSDSTLTSADNAELNTNYSYDALRIPWRIALDWYWYKEPRAQSLLKEFTFFSDQWEKNKVLLAEYSHDGRALVSFEGPAMYGGTLPALMVLDKDKAKEAYRYKLLSLYNPDTDSWRTDLGYYNENWAWFGLALYNDQLPNLWESRANKE